MKSYITQLEIIRSDVKETRESNLANFIANKIVKKIVRQVNQSNIKGIPIYEAYVYYVDCDGPVSTITNVDTETGVISGTVESKIYITLQEVGVCYNQIGTPTIEDDTLLATTQYGDFSIESFDVIEDTYGEPILDTENQYIFDTYSFVFEPNVTYYFRPYTITALGVTYGEEYVVLPWGIGYDIIEETLIIY